MVRKKLIPVVIDRKRWLVGEEYKSYLYRSADNKMCCMGFCARAAGNPVKVLRERAAIYASPGGYLKGFSDTMDDALHVAYTVNDNPHLPAKERERVIQRLLRSIGFKVTYTGKYPAAKAAPATQPEAQ